MTKQGREPDPTAAWVREHSPDDPYLPPAEPRRDPRARDLADRLQALAPAATAEEVEARAAWLEQHPGLRLLVLPRGTKPPGLDGRVATCLGRLSPEGYQRARKSGLITAAGDLAVKPPAPTKRKAVTTRHGTARYDVALLQQEFEIAEELEEAARTNAAQLRAQLRAAELEAERLWESEHTKPRDPRLPTFRWHEGSLERLPSPDEALDDELKLLEVDDGWAIWAVDDRYDTMAERAAVPNDLNEPEPDYTGHPTPPTVPLVLTEAGARELRRDVAAAAAQIAEAWRSKIDPRCANPTTCAKHPTGCCPNSPKAKTGQCPACSEWRRTHKGHDRPAELLHRERHRKGLGL